MGDVGELIDSMESIARNLRTAGETFFSSRIERAIAQYNGILDENGDETAEDQIEFLPNISVSKVSGNISISKGSEMIQGCIFVNNS